MKWVESCRSYIFLALRARPEKKYCQECQIKTTTWQHLKSLTIFNNRVMERRIFKNHITLCASAILLFHMYKPTWRSNLHFLHISKIKLKFIIYIYYCFCWDQSFKRPLICNLALESLNKAVYKLSVKHLFLFRTWRLSAATPPKL